MRPSNTLYGMYISADEVSQLKRDVVTAITNRTHHLLTTYDYADGVYYTKAANIASDQTLLQLTSLLNQLNRHDSDAGLHIHIDFHFVLKYWRNHVSENKEASQASTTASVTQ